MLFGEPEGTRLWANGIRIMILPRAVSGGGGGGGVKLCFDFIFIVIMGARGGALILGRNERPLTVETFNDVHLV